MFEFSFVATFPWKWFFLIFRWYKIMNISSELYFYISHLLNPKPKSSLTPSRLQRQYAEILDKYDNDTIKLLDKLTHSCQGRIISIPKVSDFRFPHFKKTCFWCCCVHYLQIFSFLIHSWLFCRMVQYIIILVLHIFNLLLFKKI